MQSALNAIDEAQSLRADEYRPSDGELVKAIGWHGRITQDPPGCGKARDRGAIEQCRQPVGQREGAARHAHRPEVAIAGLSGLAQTVN
jgi:hypothetical protein